MVVTGRATVFGFFAAIEAKSGGALSWSGIGCLIPENFEFNDDFELTMIKDTIGDHRILIGHGQLYRARLQFTPVTPSIPGTLAVAKDSLPPPAMLSAVDFAAGFAWAGAVSAQWVYSGGWRLSFVRDNVATYELNVLRSLSYNLSTPVPAS